jgi:hypothetical protein
MNVKYLSIFIIFISFKAYSTNFRGVIVDENNKPLPFASIFIKNTAIGTNSNEKGEFILKLDEGKHEIVFRYLGYKTLNKQVEIGKSDLFETIKMAPEVIQLADALVGNLKEDPALSIMRKTIAMSVFHDKEVESYSLKTYIKGNIKILDFPLVFNGIAKKNFIKKGQIYVFENIHQSNFKQPGNLNERVIAKKDNLPPNLKGAVSFSMGRYAMYSPENQSSPVTKKGARNYKYEYLGYFEENGQIINKIKVTPKVKGYKSGIMNIVDGSWYLHSYDFNEEDGDTKENSKAIFTNIDGVWFLSNLNYSSTFSNMGVEGEVKFVAANKEIKIIKNPKYAALKPEIIDENLFKEKATLKPKETPIQKEATLKDLQSLAKQMNKEETKKKFGTDEPDFNRSYKIDSLATKKDSVFWETERWVPLSPIEIDGFKKADSIYAANFEAINKKIKKDSVRTSKNEKFRILHLLSGHSYRTGKVSDSVSTFYKNEFKLGQIGEGSRFNAVEGFGIGINSLTFIRSKNAEENWKIGINSYYALSRKRLNGELYFNQKLKKDELNFSIGRQVFQVNENNPISPIVNAAFSFINNQNEARFFDKNYLKMSWNHQYSRKINLINGISFEQREIPSYNYVRRFSENQIIGNNTIESVSGNSLVPGMRSNRIWVQNQFVYSPKAQFGFNNGVKNIRNANNPKLTLTHELFFTEKNFGRLDLAYNHNFKIRQGNLETKTNLGFFYAGGPVSFLDYQHFMGNELWLSSHTGFRALPFYAYSSDRSYIQGFYTYNPEKLLLSQLNFIEKKGIAEHLYFNILSNPYIQYQELGYGISILNKAVRGEVFWSFMDGKFSERGFRLVVPLSKKW